MFKIKIMKIAMKVTQEEFADILSVLKENGKWLTNFTYNYEWCYLNIESAGNVELGTEDHLHMYKLLPYNKKEFLKHCGITVEESFEDYIKRVNPFLYSNFLAEKELKNRKPLFTSEDGVKIYVGDKYYFGVEADIVLVVTANNITYLDNRKRFSTKELAQEYIDKNKPQETFDGFKIKRGKVMWVVDKRFFRLHQSYGGHFIKQKGNNILFGKKENAENYIIENKVCYNYNDILDIFMDVNKQDNLKGITKEKLGFN